MSEVPTSMLPTHGGPSSDPHDATLLDRLVAEYAATGHSPTVECWLQRAAQKLTEFGQRSPNERLRRDAERIARAYVAAAGLLRVLSSRGAREAQV